MKALVWTLYKQSDILSSQIDWDLSQVHMPFYHIFLFDCSDSGHHPKYVMLRQIVNIYAYRE
jgi:hypothetical protein